MKLQDLVKTTLEKKPPRITLHGPPGVGKSTFGACAPDPIFIPTEDGLENVKNPETDIVPPHFPLSESLADFWDYMGLLINEDHEYKTVVIDTIDWLERLIHRKVCEDNSVTAIEEIGYGKGYNFSLTQWDHLFKGLTRLRNEKGMAVIMLAHNELKTYSPPDTNPYDRYQIKIHRTAAAKVEEFSDAVLFADYKVYVKTEKGKRSGRATGGERVLYTSPNPAYRTKNRYNLPEEMEFNFTKLLEVIKNG